MVAGGALGAFAADYRLTEQAANGPTRPDILIVLEGNSSVAELKRHPQLDELSARHTPIPI